MDTATIARNVVAAIPALIDRIGNAPRNVIGPREYEVKAATLRGAQVRYTDNAVLIRFARPGRWNDQLGTALLDMGAENLPLEDGEIVTLNPNTLALRF